MALIGQLEPDCRHDMHFTEPAGESPPKQTPHKPRSPAPAQRLEPAHTDAQLPPKKKTFTPLLPLSRNPHPQNPDPHPHPTTPLLAEAFTD